MERSELRGAGDDVFVVRWPRGSRGVYRRGLLKEKKILLLQEVGED